MKISILMGGKGWLRRGTLRPQGSIPSSRTPILRRTTNQTKFYNSFVALTCTLVGLALIILPTQSTELNHSLGWGTPAAPEQQLAEDPESAETISPSTLGFEDLTLGVLHNGLSIGVLVFSFIASYHYASMAGERFALRGLRTNAYGICVATLFPEGPPNWSSICRGQSSPSPDESSQENDTKRGEKSKPGILGRSKQSEGSIGVDYGEDSEGNVEKLSKKTRDATWMAVWLQALDRLVVFLHLWEGSLGVEGWLLRQGVQLVGGVAMWLALWTLMTPKRKEVRHFHRKQNGVKLELKRACAMGTNPEARKKTGGQMGDDRAMVVFIFIMIVCMALESEVRISKPQTTPSKTTAFSIFSRRASTFFSPSSPMGYDLPDRLAWLRRLLLSDSAEISSRLYTRFGVTAALMVVVFLGMLELATALITARNKYIKWCGRFLLCISGWLLRLLFLVAFGRFTLLAAAMVCYHIIRQRKKEWNKFDNYMSQKWAEKVSRNEGKSPPGKGLTIRLKSWIRLFSRSLPPKHERTEATVVLIFMLLASHRLLLIIVDTSVNFPDNNILLSVSQHSHMLLPLAWLVYTSYLVSKARDSAISPKLLLLYRECDSDSFEQAKKMLDDFEESLNKGKGKGFLSAAVGVATLGPIFILMLRSKPLMKALEAGLGALV